MREPQCFVCSNCELICTIYERALQLGYEADWQPAGEGLYRVTIYSIQRTDIEKMVDDVRMMGQQLNLPIVA